MQMQSVKFIEESHKYFIDGEEYISVTTLIDKYIPEFDAEFWSRYKALQHVLKEKYGDSKGIEYFQELKSQRNFKAPGFEEWVCDLESISQVAVDIAQSLIKKQWLKEKEDALEKGSKHHLEKEREAYSRGYSHNHFKNKSQKTVKGKGFNLDKLMPGYYPELIIWNNDFGIVGTADRVFVGAGTRKDPSLQVWIDDYKTNKEIKKQNMFEKMRYPLSRLDNCNYNHYRLQIGTYAWMLEQRGYKVKGCSINHLGEIHKIRYSSIKPFVEAMINHYSGNHINALPGVAKYGFSNIHLSNI